MTSRTFNHDTAFAELIAIGDWWLANAIDNEHGGFVGEINFDGERVEGANKGIILNSRILWFFSEAAKTLQDIDPLGERVRLYTQAAKLSFDYILKNFDDKTQGGTLWELDVNGRAVNDKKQTYAQSFCIYAFSAFYSLTGEQQALDKAFEYLALLEKHAVDPEFGGYIEAFTGDWQPISDLRLSDKDLNLPKSMNTHLHVLEAYAAIHRVAPNAETERALRYIIDIFDKHIINKQTDHLNLFFDMDWTDMSQAISFGHDIEASWLLFEALEILDDKSVSEAMLPSVLGLAKSCLTEAIGPQGQVIDEQELVSGKRHEESYWWVQAEALVGFLNAYKLTGKDAYKAVANKIWAFIESCHIDAQAGEWHWTATIDQHKASANPTYKAGFWKAPYHNGRSMMECLKLFDS